MRALHVRRADEAYLVGPAPFPRVLPAHRPRPRDRPEGRSRGDPPGLRLPGRERGLRPGLRGAGLVFIGPRSDTIALMGEKTSARRAAVAAGVPVVPGTWSRSPTIAAIAREAERIGFPVMLKAAAGGGGQGDAARRAGRTSSLGGRPGAPRGEGRLRRRPRLHREGARCGPVTSRSRCWPTPTATWSISSSASAPSSAATRR